MSVVRSATAEEEKEQKTAQDTVKFSIEICESRVWQDEYKKLEKFEEIKENNEHHVFIVRITRSEGDALVFNKLKNGFMLRYCASILKGLPKWATKMEKEANGQNKDEDDAKEAELADEYSKELGDIFRDENKGGIQVAVQ
eukprot:UN02375